MSATRQNISLNSSISSLQSDDLESTRIKNYFKEMLRSRIFLGRYIERRLIDQRIGYRDIVLLSAAEIELKRDLVEAQVKLRGACPNIHWIGIADAATFGDSSSGICLCTEIDNQPFGPFWFQIKSLKFRDDEIIVTLKCLRHISESFLEIEPILTGTSKRVKESTDNKNEKLDNSIATLNDTYQDIVGNVRNALSISNVKEFVTFLFAFVVAIFTGSTAFVNFLGNFILALIREMSVFVKNSTPMFLGMLDFFSKIVGGFYILLAMFFRPNNPAPINKRNIQHYDYNQRQNHFNDGHFD